jgi:hypothetical protein
LLTSAALGAAKPHVIGFGKWTAIKWCVGLNEGKCLDLKVRTLYVDGLSRESTLGASHDITEQRLVVPRFPRERYLAGRCGGQARLGVAARRMVVGGPIDGSHLSDCSA